MYIPVIISARGGSKGIPKKNIIDFCGKPLLFWTIDVAKKVKSVSDVWVSSDSKEILKIAKKYGAKIIKRPKNLATDKSTSVSVFLHALKKIEKEGYKVDIMVALQPTSPVRESSDVELAIKKFQKEKLDSMFSASIATDFFLWEKKSNGNLQGINHDFLHRKRRQEIKPQYLENGSIYIFKPYILRKNLSIFGGKKGVTLMEFWKSFEVDDFDDLEFCKILMKNYLLQNKSTKKKGLKE